MVDYFLNQMGIYNFQWYEQNAPHLITTTTKVIDSKFRKNIHKANIGDVVEVRHLKGHVASGRIDIRDSSKEGFDGWDEYAVPPMKQLSWNLLGDWLWDLETEEVVGYYRLIEMFEQQTRHKIEWVKESEFEYEITKA